MSLTLTDANLDKTLSLETYLEEHKKHLKFVALLDAMTCVQLGFDAPAKHQQYISSLPPGVPNDWRSYKYAKFIDPKGESILLGVPWIKPESIVEDDDAPYVITVWGVDATAISSLRSMMIANGVEHFEITRI